MKKKYQLFKTSIAGIILATSMTGCTKNMDCDIKEGHVHLYIDDNQNLAKYYKSEKENIDKFNWTEEIAYNDEKINIMIENNFYPVANNQEYLEQIIITHQPKRKVYERDYINGDYYGYGYRLNSSTGKIEYSYGLMHGYHWEYVWNEISMDEYTNELVKDYEYGFKFYKIEHDGTITTKTFKNLTNINEIEEGYDYFDADQIVEKFISEPYYLEKAKMKIK